MTNLLKLLDLTKGEITELLDLADQLKYESKNNIEHHHLKGKVLGMIFEKSSTRTRVSFETGIFQLGGTGLFLSTNDIQLGRGESIEDTANVLSRYIDGIMIRTYKQSDVEELAKYSNVPIINGLTDDYHPCQVLADLMTIREHKGKLEGLKLVYVGDGNNMANSLIVGGLKMDMKVSIAIPSGYEPIKEVLDFASKYENFVITNDIYEAVKDADIVITDTWTSMGQESEKGEREKAFEKYQVNEELMKYAKENAMVQHCLPAYKGKEISLETFNIHSNKIYDEAENRLHVQKAVMVKLMKNK